MRPRDGRQRCHRTCAVLSSNVSARRSAFICGCSTKAMHACRVPEITELRRPASLGKRAQALRPRRGRDAIPPTERGIDKHAGLPRRRVPWPPGVVSPVPPAGNNARAAGPRGALRVSHSVGVKGYFNCGGTERRSDPVEFSSSFFRPLNELVDRHFS
jgi:hypothetical protein